MKKYALGFLLLAVALQVSSLPAHAQKTATSKEVEFFEKRIRPVLAENCYSCHGDKKQRGDVRVDSRGSLVKGNDLGPLLISGQPDKSRLMHVLRYKGEIKMPPKGKLPEAVLSDFQTWIQLGAPWPGGDDKTTVHQENKSGKEHWAFQPLKSPSMPKLKDQSWVRSPIDAFILARLEEKGMKPAPPADRRTLIRRVYFDLVGLPPTYQEMEAFANDKSPDAFARVVDKLLADSRYGERWARYWLDVARYADTKGYVFLEERRYAYSYTYRDYVIRAFNQDLPYDRFLLEQLAADRLVAQDPKYDKKALAAMGFLTLGRRFLNNQHDIIDDRIDVVSRGMLGLTVGCARCHDHKYDPIPSQDYYSLYGVFASCHEPRDLPLVATPEQTPAYEKFKKELDRRIAEVTAFREKHKEELAKKNRKFRNDLRALQQKVDQFKATATGGPPRAHVLYDNAQPFQPYVFKRGKAENHGPNVPRQFLEVLSPSKRNPFTQGSGRLELAQAIANRDNPLTARVFVNRVWLHHFGRGLVDTPSDFGTRSSPPTHPDLLDYLARTFMDQGWSVKKLHRQILLSNTYQQASQGDNKNYSKDPENRLLWRMNRQRLDFEALRDSLLAVSGKLDPAMGGKSVDITTRPYTYRRTVYAFIERQNLPGIFRTFDFASPDSSTPVRFQTTVPQQALYLMNHPFLMEQVKALLDLPEMKENLSPDRKIQLLYRRIIGRDPVAEETRLALDYVSGAGPQDMRLNPWEQFAQVLLLSNEFAFID